MDIMRCKVTQNSSKYKVQGLKILIVPLDLQSVGRDKMSLWCLELTGSENDRLSRKPPDSCRFAIIAHARNVPKRGLRQVEFVDALWRVFQRCLLSQPTWHAALADLARCVWLFCTLRLPKAHAKKCAKSRWNGHFCKVELSTRHVPDFDSPCNVMILNGN